MTWYLPPVITLKRNSNINWGRVFTARDGMIDRLQLVSYSQLNVEHVEIWSSHVPTRRFIIICLVFRSIRLQVVQFSMAHPRSSSIFAPNSSQLHRWKWEANQHRRRRSWNTSRLLVGPAAVVLDAAGVELIQSAERGILTSIAADLSHLETSNKDWKWKKNELNRFITTKAYRNRLIIDQIEAIRSILFGCERHGGRDFGLVHFVSSSSSSTISLLTLNCLLWAGCWQTVDKCLFIGRRISWLDDSFFAHPDSLLIDHH